MPNVSQTEKRTERVVEAPAIVSEIIPERLRTEHTRHEVAQKTIVNEPQLIEQISREVIERVSTPSVVPEQARAHERPTNARSDKEATKYPLVTERATPAEPITELAQEEMVTWVALPEAILADLDEAPAEFMASDDASGQMIVEEGAEAIASEDMLLPETMVTDEWATYVAEMELPLLSEPKEFESLEEVCPVPHDTTPETEQYITEFEVFIAPYLPESVVVTEKDVLPLAQDLLHVAQVYRQAEAGSKQADKATEVLECAGKLLKQLGVENKVVIKHFVQAVIERMPHVRSAAGELDIDLLNYYGTHEYKAGDIGTIWQALAHVLQRQFESCKSIGNYVLRSLAVPAAV